MKTITVKLKKEQEVKMCLPVYIESGFSIIQIESEKKYTGVSKMDCDPSFQIVRNNTEMVVWYLTNGTPSTREEFEEALTRVRSYVNHKELMQTTEPATEFDIQEKIHADCASAVYDEE